MYGLMLVQIRVCPDHHTTALQKLKCILRHFVVT